MKYFNNTITILSNDKHLDEMILEYSQELSSSLHKSLTSTNSSNDDNNNVNMLIEITLNALELMDHAFQTNYSNDVDIGIFSTKADTITIVFDTIFNTNSNSNNSANTDTRVIIPLYEKSLELANTMIQLGQDDDIELISLACDIYEKLIKGYTEKQWKKECKFLPKEIIKRLPVRFTYDNNYFNDKYQGIPIDGYTKIFEKLLENIDIKLNVDYLKEKENLKIDL